jgi:hypothetical protein
MSELQISLLGIGIAVIVAVYLYNFWLQRQYQRRFGDAFKQQEDALYHAVAQKNLDALMEVAEPAQLLPTEKQRVNVPDEVCSLLDEASDYIVEIFPISLAGTDALMPLWQRRFDFGKNVRAIARSDWACNWRIAPVRSAWRGSAIFATWRAKSACSYRPK